MSTTTGIPTTRVSDLYIYRQLQKQVSDNQAQLFRLETELATGYRISRPGEDPDSAMQIIRLQRLLEQKDQVQDNLGRSQSYLATTDSALSSVASMMTDVRADALGVIGTTATDTQRSTAAEQVMQAIRQLVDTGNQSFQGRYLFGGSQTMVQPFERTAEGYIRYLGNEEHLSTYCDVDLLSQTNMTGAEVFGAISASLRGSADLDPVLTHDTRLVDLRGGQGISHGSIAISNGSKTSLVDISSAETIGDVAALIHANPPQGSLVQVEVTATGLEISLDSGNLSIKEVGGGITASELGILTKIGVGTGPVVGDDLDPILRPTTPLDNLFGVRAGAVVRSPGDGNNLIVEADRNGADLNGVTISFVDDGTVLQAGEEVAVYDPATATLQVKIKDGYTNVGDVVTAINGVHDPQTSPFTARLDPLDGTAAGQGLVDVTATAATRYGAGFNFDQDSGIQIVNGGQTHTITFPKSDGVETVEDLLNVINGAGADVIAEISETGKGIDIRSRLSGADFSIGENGGTTAAELGLRSLTAATGLEDLNFGAGVNDYQAPGTMARVTRPAVGANNDLLFTARNPGIQWNDFQISFEQQVPAGPETLTYDPVAKTMVFAVNPGQTTANDVIALAQTTPGVRDDFDVALASEPGNNDGTGLVSSGTAAWAAASWAGTNNDLLITARQSSPDFNGVAISFQACGPGAESFTYDPVAKTMVFEVDPGTTTAADVIGLFQADAPAMADFQIALNPDDGSPNDGSGAVWAGLAAATAGGSSDTAVATAEGAGGGVDFTITRSDGVVLEIDLADSETVGDVLNLINNHPDNLAGGTTLVARLASFGNGIELVDNNPEGGTLTVTRGELSFAAVDLGLVPVGQDSNTTTTAGAVATANVVFAGVNNNLIVSARGVGDLTNGVTVEFADMSGPGGPGAPSYGYDAGNRRLTFWIDPGVTTANDAITLFEQLPPIDATAVAMFSLALDPGDGTPNDGTGAVDAATATVAGGEPDLLTGADVNPQETEGLFSALLRLHHGLENNDLQEVQRAVAMLDQGALNMNFSRAELGARQQGLDVLKDRLDSEEIELRAALSEEHDADLAETISNLTARQAAFEASLRATAMIFQISLLDYL